MPFTGIISICGAPKIHALLQKKNKICSLKYVQKIMKANGIKSKTLKKYRPQSSASKVVVIAPNLFEQNFTAKNIILEETNQEISEIKSFGSIFQYLPKLATIILKTEIYLLQF